MGFSIHINFTGNCEEAVRFYAKAFGLLEPTFMRYQDAEIYGYDFPPEDANKVMHAELKIHGASIMCADVPSEAKIMQGDNIHITIDSDSEAEVRGWFNALSEGGHVDMPLTKTFFSECFGSFTDKFGIHWQLGVKLQNKE